MNTSDATDSRDGLQTVVSELFEAAGQAGIELHAMLVQRKGDVLAEAYREPYGPDIPHRMYSVTKSFTSTAIGFAVSEQRLSVEDRVIDLFPEWVPAALHDTYQELQVKHLLAMRAGHAMIGGSLLSRPSPSISEFFETAMPVTPGARFDYSNPSSYMLAAIVARVTGSSLLDYLTPRLLEPLGIPDKHWLKSQEGINNGGWGLHLTARELARFGQFYLQRGMWEGKQLLPAAWIDQATSSQGASWGPASMPDWHQGYCFQFWRGRHNSYRADGLLGQFCVILPDLDAFVVTHAGTAKTQALLDLIWGRVLPALEKDGGTRAEGEPALIGRASQTTDVEAQAASHLGVYYNLLEQFALPSRFYGGQSQLTGARLDEESGALNLTLFTAGAQYRFSIASGQWTRGTSPISTGYPEPYAIQAGAGESGGLEIELVFTEGGFALRLQFEAGTNELKVKLPENPGLDGRIVIGRPYP